MPPPPDKQAVGRFESDFVESRRAALERMLNKVTSHHILQHDADLKIFLESEAFNMDVRNKERKDPGFGESKGVLGSIGWGSSNTSKFVEYDDVCFESPLVFHLQRCTFAIAKCIIVVSRPPRVSRRARKPAQSPAESDRHGDQPTQVPSRSVRRLFHLPPEPCRGRAVAEPVRSARRPCRAADARAGTVRAASAARRADDWHRHRRVHPPGRQRENGVSATAKGIPLLAHDRGGAAEAQGNAGQAAAAGQKPAGPAECGECGGGGCGTEGPPGQTAV